VTDLLSRDEIVARGAFAPERNAAIFDKWYTPSPSHFLRYALKKYSLDRKVAVDVGSGFGHALRRFGAGSYGLELNEGSALFSASVGLTVFRRDAERDDLSDLPKADAVWCRDVLEHVDSPHTLLRKMWYLLRDEGLAFFVVPMVHKLRVLRHLAPLQRRLGGYLAEDHRNFFTVSSLRLTCERAGYDVTELTAGLGPVVDGTPLIELAPSVMAVLRKSANWEYSPKSTRRAAPNLMGYEYNNPDLF
jgi:SAM-dependent methyltransferase